MPKTILKIMVVVALATFLLTAGCSATLHGVKKDTAATGSALWNAPGYVWGGLKSWASDVWNGPPPADPPPGQAPVQAMEPAQGLPIMPTATSGQK